MADNDEGQCPRLMGELQIGYASGALSVEGVMGEILVAAERAAGCNAWIHRVPEAQLLARARELDAWLGARGDAPLPPLFGVPFVVKDNIDVAGLPTTAGCPDFAYTPEHSARAVEKAMEAGALLVGKTNLDQFATGLVGTRSPYGACSNPRNPDYIAGGSSAGSAVAVACGAATFALGTDTAGSGRVPAALNNLVGLKPSRGAVSNRGVFPACRSLDCVSIFALSGEDAATVFRIVAEYDEADPFARRLSPPQAPRWPEQLRSFRFAVPRQADLEFFGDAGAKACFRDAVARLETLGGEAREIDFGAFREASCLLYEGPWIAERYLSVRDFLAAHPDSVMSPTAEIIARGQGISAADAFASYYRLKRLQRDIAALWSDVDCLLTPTVPTTYRRDEIAAEPVAYNSRLGYYTNFMNLLDLCAYAVPVGFLECGQPFGVTLSAPAFHEQVLYPIATALHRAGGTPLGASDRMMPPSVGSSAGEGALGVRPPDSVLLAVCGAHMEGLPLNHQLTGIGANLQRRMRTAPRYRLYHLHGFEPARPGMVRDAAGTGIEVEVWAVPSAAFGGFVDRIPAPLTIGSVELESGDVVNGFLCESHVLDAATEISDIGGWRQYLQTTQGASVL
ncbi:allophanate hydrolase [Algiphilus aromaticivorans]|uniref:allophanate hydrolase n=1 Tax=Algiphilus aromaticivorans TaxID=382454 RepID=UPI000A640B61|nr:allophanate hydrolase [Algiphilus aromaticivorans]